MPKKVRKEVPATNTTSSSFWAKIFFTILVIVSLINHALISLTQNTPYMDELFHITQTQKYCEGNYRAWDDKITTLPGLYVIPSILALLYGSYFQCTPLVLRSVNLVITFCIYWTFYYLLGAKKPAMSEKKQAFMAYTLTLFPLNYFFTFLYYTDQLSTFLVLLMSYLAYKKYTILSAVAGAYSVFTRQTNIIWVMWMSFFLTWNILRPELTTWNKNLVDKLRPTGKNTEKKGIKPKGSGQGLKLPDLENYLLFWSRCIIKIAPTILPYAIIGIAFLIFVIINGGIVVGDRLAHQPSLNIPQLFYFAIFVGFMLWPLIALSGPIRTLKQIRKHWPVFLTLVVMGLIIVHYNTIVHQYLLADNRHYTFYFWKRFYEWYPISRYLLVPCYIVIWFWIYTSIQWDPVLFIGFVACLAASVIPQKLLEFRYFIIPFYFLRLNINYTEWKYLILECLFYVLLNGFTIYQFLMNPFLLEGKSEISRFMW